jgi:chromosomal replication initiator protein
LPVPLLSEERRVPHAVIDDPADPEPDAIWRRIDGELRRAVPADVYEIWLAPLRLAALHGRDVEVDAPPELRAWVADRCARALRAAATAVLGPEATIRVRTGDDTRDAGALRRPPARVGREDAVPGDDASELNPKYTFEQFVIGVENHVAHGAALAVAELPGQAFNPLFIYGPPGVGKTHLLHSIGNYVRAGDSGLTVRYTTVETFTNQFVAAVHGGSVQRFKGRFRHNDVLLIDDVQFLASKARTEEEFFHTFTALYEAGSQLVLTSDRLPRDLEALEDRLRERFESGLVTAIDLPDHDTRMTVLRKRVQHDRLALDDDVLSAIAERVPTNVRALEGALIRVVAFASLTGRAPSASLAREVLDDLAPRVRPVPGSGHATPSIDEVKDAAAEAFGVSRDDLESHARGAGLTWPRQVAMYLAREHTRASLPAIGARFGGRNHTTVIHACRRVAERMATDPDAHTEVRHLTERLGGRRADRRD